MLPLTQKLSASEIQGIYKLVQGFKSIQVKYVPRGLDLVHRTQAEHMRQAPHLLEALTTYLYLGNSRQEQGHTVTCMLPSHPHSWKSSLKSLLRSLPQYLAEQRGSRRVRLALDATSGGDRRAAWLPQQAALILPRGNPTVLRDGCRYGACSQEQSSGWSMEDEQTIFFFFSPPSPPEKQASRPHCSVRK